MRSRHHNIGGTERQRKIFYTAFTVLSPMTDITEDGRYFSGYDHKVNNAEGTTST